MFFPGLDFERSRIFQIPNRNFIVCIILQDVVKGMKAARAEVNKDLQSNPDKSRAGILSSLKKTMELAVIKDTYHRQTVVYLKALGEDVGAEALEFQFYDALTDRFGAPKSLEQAASDVAKLPKTPLYTWCSESAQHDIDGGSAIHILNIL